MKRVPLDPKVVQRCGAALRTLAHPERLRIVELLESGPKTVGEIVACLRRPQATISQHLMRLRVFGLVHTQRDGRSIYYAIGHAGCRTILNCIRTHFAPKSDN
jgi:ArsR family transcriptional regulator